VEPEAFKELKPLEAYVKHETPAYLKGGTHKGASQHLRAFGVGQLISVTFAGRTPTEIKAREQRTHCAATDARAETPRRLWMRRCAAWCARRSWAPPTPTKRAGARACLRACAIA
jgi:hypothetical protein